MGIVHGHVHRDRVGNRHRHGAQEAWGTGTGTGVGEGRTLAVLGTGSSVLVQDAPADRVLFRRRLEVPGKGTCGGILRGCREGMG